MRVSSSNAWLKVAALIGSSSRCLNESFPVKSLRALSPVLMLWSRFPHTCQRFVPHHIVQERKESGEFVLNSDPIGVKSNVESSCCVQMSIVVSARKSLYRDGACDPVAAARS